MRNRTDLARCPASIARGAFLATTLAPLFMVSLAACGGADKSSNPGTSPKSGSVPTQIVGVWRYAFVSEIGYTDPVTGQYTPGSAQTMSYTIQPDGQFTIAYLEKNMVAGCWTSIFRSWSGTMTVQDVQWVLNQTRITEKGEGNCGVTPYEKTFAGQIETEEWKVDESSKPRALWTRPVKGDATWHGPFDFQG